MRRTVTFESRPTLAFTLMLLVMTLAATHVVNATAIVQSSVQIEDIFIFPLSNGYSVQFSPTAGALASAYNSLGQLDLNTASGTAVSVSASVTWANAAASANSNSRTGAASGSVHILGKTPPSSSASATTQASLSDSSFSIIGANGPVEVEFVTVFSYLQSLMTDANGTSAASHVVVVDLIVQGNNLVWLSEDISDYSLGPNSFVLSSGTLNLSGATTLMANQTYTLNIDAGFYDTVANTGLPEPATLSLFFAGILPPVILRRLRR